MYRRYRRARTLPRTFVTALTAAALGATLTSSALAATATSGPCSRSVDPYTLSIAELNACGAESYPLSSVTMRSDGAHEYNFKVGRLTVSYIEPPASFQPARASTAELSRYPGLTPPPEGSTQRPLWQQMIDEVQFGPPPARQVIVPRSSLSDVPVPSTTLTPLTSEAGAEKSLNWSGYDNYASTQKYNTAAAYYVEPEPKATCSGAQWVAWAGLGGKNSGNLEQNGTANYVPYVGSHEAWWEVLPYGIAPVEGTYATAGAYFEAQTHWVNSEKVSFYFYNYSTKKAKEVNVSGVPGSDRSTADYIVERPAYEEGGHWYLPPLTSYSPITMQGFSNGTALENNPYNSQQMFEITNTLLASASGIGEGSSYQFTDTYHNCGGVYKLK